MTLKFLNFFIFENSKHRINFIRERVTNVTLKGIGSNCGIFKQASESSPNEFCST